MGIKQILKIPRGYKIMRFEEMPEGLNVYIEPYKNKKAVCSGCGEIHKKGYHGGEEMKVRDLPAGGRKIYLRVSKRRYLCPKDGKIHVEHLEWVKKKEDIPIDLLKKFIV